MPIAFLSDVEGRFSKLDDFCADNPYVTLEPSDSGGSLRVRQGATFVYGGDTVDRGPDSRRLLRALVEVRLRQPEQVVLLAGNRDINKLRLPRELGGFPRPGAPVGSRAALTRWTLARTMGAADAFAHRARELALDADAQQDAIVASMLEDVGFTSPDPSATDGLLLRYLTLAQIAWRSGESLFVHGGVTDENFGVVPEAPSHEQVDDWVAALNAFFADQMRRYRLDPTGQSHLLLIQYQAPNPGTRANPHSVVYARPVDASGNTATPSARLRARLAACGIRRLVVGHTPAGDTPGILRVDGFELIIADSSYGTLERGSQVLIDGTRTVIRAHVRPVGEAPQRLSCDLDLDTVSPVGRRDVHTGQIVKGRLDDGRYLLCRFLPGFVAEEVAVADLEGRVFETEG